MNGPKIEYLRDDKARRRLLDKMKTTAEYNSGDETLYQQIARAFEEYETRKSRYYRDACRIGRKARYEG